MHNFIAGNGIRTLDSAPPGSSLYIASSLVFSETDYSWTV